MLTHVASTQEGGGLYISGAAVLKDSKVHNNKATGSTGGAVYVAVAVTATFTSSVFVFVNRTIACAFPHPPFAAVPPTIAACDI